MEDAEFPSEIEADDDAYISALEKRLSALLGLTWEWRRAKAAHRTKFCYRRGSCLRPDGHSGDCFPSMVLT